MDTPSFDSSPAVAAPAAPAPKGGEAAKAPKPAPAAGIYLEETNPRVKGEIIAVPVEKLTMDTYINVGSAQGAQRGDRFLVWNQTVRLIAIVKIQSAQDRMSTVSTEAQMAAIRVGDSVKRITPDVAAEMRKKMEALGGYAPELGTTVEVDPNILAISRSVGFAKPPESTPSAPQGGGTSPAIKAGAPSAPRGETSPAMAVSGPDVSDVMLLANATAKGISISWTAPASGSPQAGYNIYRSNSASTLGTLLTPQPTTAFNYDDNSMPAGTPCYYRLAGVGAGGAISSSLPSLEATWTAPVAGSFGMGGSDAAIKASSLPLFANVPVAATKPAPAIPAPKVAPKAPALAVPVPVPAIPIAPPPMATPPGIPAVPAAAVKKPPLPSAPPAPAVPVPAVPAIPAPIPAAAQSVPAVPPVPAIPPIPAAPAVPKLPAMPVPSAPVAAPVPIPVPATSAPKTEAAADNTAPPPPERTSAYIEGSTVVVKWNPAFSKIPIVGYMVYRSFPGDETGAPLTSAPINDEQYKDRTAKEGMTYVYWVCTQGADGKLSPPSGKPKVEIPKSTGVPFF